jgi:hypothetical protein
MSEERGPAPELAGADDSFEVERASATPLAPASVGTEEPARVVTPEEIMRGPLSTMLEWFVAGVMDPRGVPGRPVEEVLTAGPQLSARGRLDLYRFAYRARLVECLADDYPAVKYALGADEFEKLAHQYIEWNPSKNPSLNYYSKKFSEFTKQLGAHFVADLARLEWAMVEVLHAPAAPVLEMAKIAELPPEAHPNIRFVPSKTLRFHEFDYPVNAFLRGFKTGQSPKIPERAWAGTAIYRKGYVVWRMDFTRPMANVLSALLNGETLGDALNTIPEDANATLVNDVMIWFREWVLGGFFAQIV